MLARDDDRVTYSVSELTAAVRLQLEERFPMVWVEGELSNLRVPSSGHWYFTLKDDRAQLRCAMFKNRNRFIRFDPRDGMQVVVRGRVSLYEARGDFQLIADHLEPSGEGALRAAFEALKRSLAEEGLFAVARKRPLPDLPTHVAVISSPTGAALEDIVSVFRRRAPHLKVTLLPCLVQGAQAEADLNRAFAALGRWPKARLGAPPEVVLVARGGGSIEDLWPFNLESVARSIAACPMPVVSAVGHETDITIADFVADVRAPTPSAGAELIAPDRGELARVYQELFRHLTAHVQRALTDARRELRHLADRLVDPRRQLQQQAQRIDDAEQTLRRAVARAVADRQTRLDALTARLNRVHPRRELPRLRSELTRWHEALVRVGRERVAQATRDVAGLSRALHAVSPLDTLARGYAIVARPDGSRWGKPVYRANALVPGEPIQAHLADGRLTATVTEVTVEDSNDGKA